MIQKFDLYEKKSGKKKKDEKDAIVDKYQEYIDKIEDKRVEFQNITFGDDSPAIKAERIAIKRIEVEMAEKELDIIKLRDRKLHHKKQLKSIESHEKERNK